MSELSFDPEAARQAVPPEQQIALALAMSPELRAAELLPGHGNHQERDMAGLLLELSRLSGLAREGNFGRGINMLVSQAHVLDAVFHQVLQRMTAKPERFESLLPLALKTQAQCRVAWDSVAALQAQSKAKGGSDGQAERSHASA